MGLCRSLVLSLTRQLGKWYSRDAAAAAEGEGGVEQREERRWPALWRCSIRLLMFCFFFCRSTTAGLSSITCNTVRGEISTS